MISEKMKSYAQNNSAIRAMFEEGKRLAAIYGAEHVYDFSLGNPNVAAPDEVRQSLIDILQNTDASDVHGYMNNAGYESVRAAIAVHLNKLHGTNFHENNIMMTVGAAGGLNVILKTLLNPQDEVLTFAPFFGEYRNYVANYDGILNAVPPNTATFQPDLVQLEQMVTARTKAIIINSPNNPTGVVYSEETIKGLAAVLNAKQQEFGTEIYLISDEPYRELVYDQAVVPYLTKYYDNTIVCYSYSKSLSLPGERIGYLVIPDELADFEQTFEAAKIANRILGFVNAPSLMQLAVARCLDAQTDVSYYNRNRELLYNSLIQYGYTCVKPEGAFYLFVKSPVEQEQQFCEAAKNYKILLVPGSSFGCAGFVRISYCVSYETIVHALPKFKELAREYGLQ